jgi:hypothetical protein
MFGMGSIEEDDLNRNTVFLLYSMDLYNKLTLSEVKITDS